VLRSSDQIWYWLYLSNWKTVWDYGGPINHFWSLAIEEQFYLMWPLLVWCLSRRRLLAVCSAVVAASLVARNMPAAVATQAIAGDFLYRVTPFRLDGLAAGAVVALLVRDERITGCLTRWSGWLAGGTACLPLAVMACLGTTGPHSVGMARFGYSAFALTFAALVLYAATHAGAPAPLPVLLRCGFLRSFGRYSYAIYIFHWLFTSYVRGVAVMLLPGCSTVLSIVAGAAISWSLAWCSWHAFESRFLALKDRMDAVGDPVNQRLPEPLFTP
jgi:peptidoglycan/LPS O-acetylase OafA/YrhL